jgi:penicillin amidase
VTGTATVEALSAPVTVVRDRWGVAHIDARSTSDLFVAQGFVQAEDRIFQMDLWRRAAQGRLSEVLGPNFIERDAMTRRIQFYGDLAAEWDRYGRDARGIAESFVRGINAWVTLARARPPEAFVLAGWRPDFWSANDLLNRTDAFVEDESALRDILRQGLSDVVGDAIRRAGAPPFLVLLAAPVPGGSAALDRELLRPGAFRPASAGEAWLKGSDVAFAEARGPYAVPSLRYVVHLRAPGWNVVGLTTPWRPGVAIGHNERIAWAAAASGNGIARVSVEPIDRSASRIVKDAITVKGREEPFEFETEITSRGVVVATDRVAGQQFTLDWSGFEPGAAPEMAALGIDRAQTFDEYDAARLMWKLPPRAFVFANVGGRIDVGRLASASSAAPATRRAVFTHPLAVTDRARRYFDVGPVDRPPGGDQPVRLLLVPRAWDDSLAMNAPGQSESPGAPHYSDLAALWSAGDLYPLVFSDAAVREYAEATLTLAPAARR